MDSYSPKAVANAFLALAQKEGEGITPMKMQKLIYLAHGWGLGIVGQPLINEPVQAWKYGPVIESIYKEFKRFGNQPITADAVEYSFNTDTLELDEETPLIRVNDVDAHDLIEHTWNAYKQYSGGQLSTLTHQPDTPWHRSFNGKRDVIISDNLIASHYQTLNRQQSAGR